MPEQLLLLPYPGLRPFETEDQALFFGREAQVEALLRLLEDDHFLAVVGSSGCGKSSLVRAGLLPAIHEGFLLGTTDWRIVVIKPGHQPYLRLAAKLSAIASFSDESAHPQTSKPNESRDATLLATLRKTDHGLLDVLDSLKTPKPTMVVVDQFEELFAFRSENAKADEVVTRDEAAAFVKMLLRTCDEANGQIWVLLTMRSDFIGDCEAFLGLPEAVSRSQFLVPRLDRSQMEEAIRHPGEISRAAFAPFTFEEGLVNRIINDAGDRPDQLPLMQHALMRTWKFAVQRSLQESASVHLQHVDYIKAGAIAEALSHHADEAWGQIQEDPKKAGVARRLFLLLCDVSPNGQIIRRRPRVCEVEAVTGASITEIDEVIRLFQADDRNFLLLSGPIDSDTYIDISHESLIRQWRTLADWLKEEAKSAESYREILKSELRWKQDNGELLRGGDLALYLNWWEREKPSPDWAERYGSRKEFILAKKFLNASEEAKRKAIAAEKEKKESELRRARFLAWSFGLLATILVLGFLIYYVVQIRESDGYYNSVVKVRGVPEGIGPLTAEQVSHRASSYKITRKGIRGPVIRRQIVNAVGQPMTGSGVISGFEKSSSSTDQSEAQGIRLEYVYDNKKMVAYEVSLDRFGRRLRSVIYSPSDPATGNTREAFLLELASAPQQESSSTVPQEHSVAPAPQKGSPFSSPQQGTMAHASQQGSCVDFVSYEYNDKEGYELLTRYRDKAGKPTPGRDNAISMRKEYDEKGNERRLISLWRDDLPMNDQMGNAVYSLSYDNLGNPLIEEAYDAGGAPIALKTEGYFRLTHRYDEFGNEITRSYFDEFNNPVNHTKEGWHRSEYRYDERGNVVEQIFSDADGSSGEDSNGCHRLKTKFDKFDNAIETACLGPDGQAKLIDPGFTVWRNAYDDDKRPIESTYFDAAENPVNGPEGAFRVRVGYDVGGNVVETAYFAPDGKPSVCLNEYHKQISQFVAGREIRTEYLGVNGKPTVREGYAAIERGYNAQGNQIKLAYLDADNRPVAHQSEGYGYAIWLRVFDSCGREIESRFLDEKQHAVQPVAYGYAIIRKAYDVDNHVSEETYFDAHERPVRLDGGYARLTQSWDRHGNLVDQRYFDENLEPVRLKNSYAEIKYRYDDHNGILQMVYFGDKEEPVLNSEGWARIEYKNDDHGRNVERAHFGVRGEPVIAHIDDETRFHRAKRKLDPRGNPLELEYFGTDGKPLEVTMNGARCAKIVQRFDAKDEVIDWECYDASGHRAQ